MASATRVTKSFSLDRRLFKEVERSRGSVSTSERVNQLLRAGLEAERRQILHVEAARFFRSVTPEEDRARQAFQAASIKSLIRE